MHLTRTGEPPARFTGTDGSGQVHVEIDHDVARPRVTLGTGWRSAVRPDALGAAVLQAFHAAAVERLIAAAAAPPVAAEGGPPAVAALRDGAPDVTLARRVWEDVHEFRRNLTGLTVAARTASSPDRRVRVTVCGGQVVGTDLARPWRDTAPDQELEDHLNDGLRAGLALISDTPQQALDGCPYLQSVLAAPRSEPAPVVEPTPLDW